MAVNHAKGGKKIIERTAAAVWRLYFITTITTKMRKKNVEPISCYT